MNKEKMVDELANAHVQLNIVMNQTECCKEDRVILSIRNQIAKSIQHITKAAVLLKEETAKDLLCKCDTIEERFVCQEHCVCGFAMVGNLKN